VASRCGLSGSGVRSRIEAIGEGRCASPLRSESLGSLAMPRAPSLRRLPAVALLLAVAAPAPAQAPKPAHKETSARLIPKEVTFTTEVTPSTAKPGDAVTYKVTAKVAAPWHIYAYLKTPPKGGPAYTKFDLFDPAGLSPAGDWAAAPKPIRQPDNNFPGVPFLEFHEGVVTWSLPMQVPEGIEAGKKAVRSQISFMICNDKVCKPQVWHTLPDAAVTIRPGGAAGGAAAAAASWAALTVGATPGPPAATPGGVQETIDKGLLPFLAFSAVGGLLALLMPCVWPMVPVTVNFFVKQGQARQGTGTTGLAVTYCLAIIGIFTAVGLLFSAVLGASSLSRLANNPWLNLAVAGIFIAFGLSLLGLFEIGLPGFLLNASAKGEGRGGLVGVIFMALTLTITSFTCTFPVVGGLLVLAARGSYLYPTLGLATFATVLALPFFVLALAPGLLAKLPRSGDWMNAVKVVGGLVEIGAAFKFINTAEIGLGSTPDNAWFDSSVLLSIWVVLFLVCGLYLLGVFRTDHDQGQGGVGPGRVIFGTLFLSLALYLTPALFGVPPKSRVYERLVVGILPADSGKLDRMLATGPIPTSTGAPVPEADREAKATSKEPKVAAREERRVHGVAWGFSYDAALEEAKKSHRPILIDFTGVNCANCRLMERSVMPKSEVIAELRKFVPVQLYTDFVPIDSISQGQREELATANLEREVEMTDQQVSPLYVVVSPEGKVVATIGGYNEVPAFLKFLRDALGKQQAMAGTVAGVGG